MRLKMAFYEGFQDRTTLQLFQNQGPGFDCGEYMIRCISPKGICSIYLTNAELDSFITQVEEVHANRSQSKS